MCSPLARSLGGRMMSTPRKLCGAGHALPTLKREQSIHWFWQSEPRWDDSRFVDRCFDDAWYPSGSESEDHPFGHWIGGRPSHSSLSLSPIQIRPPRVEAGVEFVVAHY
jgi:hypothetical protein